MSSRAIESNRRDLGGNLGGILAAISAVISAVSRRIYRVILGHFGAADRRFRRRRVGIRFTQRTQGKSGRRPCARCCEISARYHRDLGEIRLHTPRMTPSAPASTRVRPASGGWRSAAVGRGSTRSDPGHQGRGPRDEASAGARIRLWTEYESGLNRFRNSGAVPTSDPNLNRI